MTMNPRWDAPTLQVASDTARRARYRALQSLYRENTLGVPAGQDARGRTVGSLLPKAAVAENPGLNFLNKEIAAYVERRIPEVQKEGGTIEVDRLRRNMLSSMPLCFNLFGYLRGVPTVAASVFSRLLNLDIAEIELIEVEWAPPPELHLQDRTAFDAFVRYRLHDRQQKGFLGVEVKYTEPFSPTEYESERYRELTRLPDSGFKPGAASRLVGTKTNQLWRNVLLTQSLKRAERVSGHCVVVACLDDPGAQTALTGLQAELFEPGEVLRFQPLEELVAAFAAESETQAWAESFRRRYLALPPERT